MSTKEVTLQDVIDYIESRYDSNHYEVQGSKLYIKSWVFLNDYPYSTLPSGVVFNSSCDLEKSSIEFIPDDIVLHGGLYLNNTSVKTLPVLYIGGALAIMYTDIVLQDGTYIEYKLWARHSRYWCLSGILINGYFFEDGILS